MHEEREKFVEEYEKNADGGNPTNEKKQRFHRANRDAPVVGQLLPDEFPVKPPADEQGYHESAQWHEELRDCVVEQIKEAATANGQFLPRSEGERAEAAKHETDEGDDGCGTLPAVAEVLGYEGGADFVHADAARQGCQQEQDIKEKREDVTHDGHVSESEQEDIWQGDEDEAGACVGCYADAKHRGENDETAQDGNHRVDDADVHRRFHQPCLVAEIRCVGHQTTQSDAERKECLAHGTKDDVGRDLVQVGFQQEADAVGGAWHGH